MKKIISALVMGAMVAGVAFADFSASVNYRQRAALLSHNFEYEKGGKTVDATSKTMFLDAYSGNGTDNATINIAGDIASFDIVLVGDQNTTNKIRAKTLGANLRLAKIDFFGGFWADGKLNGAYRNKADIDAGNLEGMDFEFKKLGSAYAGSPSFFMDNYVMPVNVTASESYAVGARYAIPGLKKLKATVTGSYITNTKSDGQTASSGQLQGHTGVLHVDTRSAFGNIEGVFKYGQVANGDTAMAFGAYALPSLPIDNLTVSVGGAGSVIDSNFTDWSADLRVYYKMGDLSFTSFNSYSAIVDPKENTAKLNGKKNAGTKGIAESAPITNGKHGGSAISRDAILANNLMARYKINKTFSVFGIVADMIGMGTNEGNDVANKDGKKDNDALVQLRASGWVQAFSGASSVSLGCVYEINDVTEAYGDSFKCLAIPVIFRVKF